MSHSGIVDLVYRLVPFRAVKARLAEHAEKCPACAARLAGRDDVRRVLIGAADLGPLDDIWPAVRKGACRSERNGNSIPIPAGAAAPKSRLWRFAAAGLGLAFAAGLTVAVVRYFGSGSGGAAVMARAEGSFEIHYARIQQKPADTFIVHSPGDGIVLVWVEKNL